MDGNENLKRAFERHRSEVDSRTDAESEAILRGTVATFSDVDEFMRLTASFDGSAGVSAIEDRILKATHDEIERLVDEKSVLQAENDSLRHLAGCDGTVKVNTYPPIYENCEDAAHGR